MSEHDRQRQPAPQSTLDALRQAVLLRWGADRATAIDRQIQTAAQAIDRVLAVELDPIDDDPEPIVPAMPDA